MKAMKKHFLLFLVLNVYAIVSAEAQQFEGKTVTQTVMIAEPNSPAKAQDPIMATTWVKGSRTRMEMKSTFMGLVVTLADYDKNESVTLIDMMGKKIALVSTLDDLNKMAGDQGAATLPQNMSCKDTGKTKNILGHTCHEVQCTYAAKGGEESTMSAWYCKDIAINPKQYAAFAGMPFEYSVRNGRMTMNVTTVEISREPVSDTLFSIPEGYVVSTPEEMMKTMHGK
jgi:GLPGLI family protein